MRCCRARCLRLLLLFPFPLPLSVRRPLLFYYACIFRRLLLVPPQPPPTQAMPLLPTPPTDEPYLRLRREREEAAEADLGATAGFRNGEAI